MLGTTLLAAWLAASSIGAADPLPQSKIALPAPEPAVLRISTVVSTTDGKPLGASSAWPLKEPSTTIVLYAASGATLCMAASATPEPEPDYRYGWRIEIAPGNSKTFYFFNYNGASTNKVVAGTPVAFTITWTRMWDNGKPVVDAAKHTATVTLHPGEHIQLDYLIATERTPPPNLASFDASNFPGATSRELTSTQNLYAQLTGRVATSTPSCNAIGMGLEISLDPVKSSAISQTDVWLVHTLPSGQEESQHQVLRARPGDVTPYYFDDLTVATPQGAVTIKVHGDLKPSVGNDGQVHAKLAISRDCSADPAVNLRVRSAGMTYELPPAGTDVLSFNLPVPSDSPLAGHTFSVRVRSTLIR
jgi:hypothetical protein